MCTCWSTDCWPCNDLFCLTCLPDALHVEMVCSGDKGERTQTLCVMAGCKSRPYILPCSNRGVLQQARAQAALVARLPSRCCFRLPPLCGVYSLHFTSLLPCSRSSASTPVDSAASLLHLYKATRGIASHMQADV
jgi:hypothetical protein